MSNMPKSQFKLVVFATVPRMSTLEKKFPGNVWKIDRVQGKNEHKWTQCPTVPASPENIHLRFEIIQSNFCPSFFLTFLDLMFTTSDDDLDDGGYSDKMLR